MFQAFPVTPTAGSSNTQPLMGSSFPRGSTQAASALKRPLFAQKSSSLLSVGHSSFCSGHNVLFLEHTSHLLFPGAGIYSYIHVRRPHPHPQRPHQHLLRMAVPLCSLRRLSTSFHIPTQVSYYFYTVF